MPRGVRTQEGIEAGQRLVARREARGLTQFDVAKELGVVPGTVHNWEVGQHAPRPRFRAKLAKLLGGEAGDYAHGSVGAEELEEIRGRLAHLEARLDALAQPNHDHAPSE